MARTASNPNTAASPSSATSITVGTFENVFSDKDIRHKFVSKVYTIVLAQVLLTTAIMSLFVISEDARDWAEKNSFLYLPLALAGFGIMLALTCCPGVQRQHPINIILLFTFTAIEGFSLGIVIIHYKTETVIYALVLTCVIFAALTVYAIQTAVDYTTCGAMVLVSAFALMFMGIILMFFRSHMMVMIYSIIGVLLFCFYIIYDTQLIVGGQHRQMQISPEDYVMAALILYMDVINLFLLLLQLLNELNNGDN